MSDRERERLARRLVRESVDGRMSVDTFTRRVERAYAARTRGELDDLARDLPHTGRAVRLLAEAAYRLSSARTAIRQAWSESQVPRLELPDDGRTRLVVGRDPACDLSLAGETVSRRHALLVRRDDGWTITDLGSLNGTRLNGWRVFAPTALRMGDVVSFGGTRYRVAGDG